MKPRQRQAAILEHLQKQGKCSVGRTGPVLLTRQAPLSVRSGHSGKCRTVIRTYGGVVLNSMRPIRLGY